MNDLWALPATELQAAMAQRRTTSEAIVRAHLNRIEAVDDGVRAFTEVLAEDAIETAKRMDAERAAGQVRGPLHGLPVSVKECLAMQGRASTVGLLARRSTLSTSDAAIVTLLREGGAVILGRTNLSQNMIYAECNNPVFGTTTNPFSNKHTPGGSSGGEGAAVAAGMSCLGIGTDIGGSVRIPAAFCGVYALMPTLDRWPLWGSVASIAGQETIRGAAGPLARTARDLAMLARAFPPARASALDPRTPPLPWAEPTSVVGKTFGLLLHDGVMDPSPALVRAASEAAEALRTSGAKVVFYKSKLLAEAAYLYLAAMSADGAKTLMESLAGEPAEEQLQGLLKIAKLPTAVRRTVATVLAARGENRAAKVLRAIGEKSVAELWKLHTRMRGLRAELLAEWAQLGLDAVICPPGATTALPLGGSKDFVLGMTYTYVWNLFHFAAGVAPVTSVRDNEVRGRREQDRFDRHAAKVDSASLHLPAGVQIVARPYADELVLGALMALDDKLRSQPGYPITPTQLG